jgi:hypothetical protein
MIYDRLFSFNIILDIIVVCTELTFRVIKMHQVLEYITYFVINLLLTNYSMDIIKEHRILLIFLST